MVAHHLIEMAERAGLAGPAFEQALSHPAARGAILARLEDYVDSATSHIETRGVFLYHIANTAKAWAPLLETEDLANIANQLRGADVLKGQSSVHWSEEETFGQQAWWPC